MYYSSGFNKNMITTNTREKPTDDNVYIDIKISNNTDARAIKAKYDQTRTTQILDNPSNYYLSLVRWKIPGFELPLLIFPVEPNPLNPDDLNYSQYSVTLETSTDIYQFHLFYMSYNDPNVLVPPPTNSSPYQSNSQYYFIYDYQHMLNIVNYGLLMAFENVTGKPVGAEFPYLIYNPETKLFSLIAQFTNYMVDLAPSPAPPAQPTTQPTFDADIKVYMNFKLYSLFNGLPSRTVAENSAESTQGRDVQILIHPYGNNYFPDPFVSSDYLRIEQNFSSISYWNPVKQLIFITELIPINSEYTAVSGDSFRKILTDFEPSSDSNTDIRTTFQYFPQGVYRLIDLIGTKPLYNIDLQVKWIDINGHEYFVTIAPFQELTAKLLFVKRNLYKTNNLLYEN
jgi:hypothetical protein